MPAPASRATPSMPVPYGELTGDAPGRAATACTHLLEWHQWVRSVAMGGRLRASSSTVVERDGPQFFSVLPSQNSATAPMAETTMCACHRDRIEGAHQIGKG